MPCTFEFEPLTVPHLRQRVGRANICFADAPGRQHSVEVVVIAGHDVIRTVGEDLRVHDVDAARVQRQRVVRQRPAVEHI